MTTTTTKRGRPARSKESLFAEIQRHKSYTRDLFAEIQRLKARLDVSNTVRQGYERELDGAYDKIVTYKTAPLLDRLKYVIKKDI